MSEIPPVRSPPAKPARSACCSGIILLRPGEPLDVRKLYIEGVRDQRPSPTRATRTTLQIGAESEVLRHLLQRLPGQLLAALVDAGPGGAAGGAHRVGPRRRLPPKATGARISGGHRDHQQRRPPTSAEFEIELAPFEDGG